MRSRKRTKYSTKESKIDWTGLWCYCTSYLCLWNTSLAGSVCYCLLNTNRCFSSQGPFTWAALLLFLAVYVNFSHTVFPLTKRMKADKMDWDERRANEREAEGGRPDGYQSTAQTLWIVMRSSAPQPVESRDQHFLPYYKVAAQIYSRVNVLSCVVNQ